MYYLMVLLVNISWDVGDKKREYDVITQVFTGPSEQEPMTKNNDLMRFSTKSQNHKTVEVECRMYCVMFWFWENAVLMAKLLLLV